MYKVKRFNIAHSYEEQRCYGLLGKARKLISNKVDNSIKDSLKKYRDTLREIDKFPKSDRLSSPLTSISEKEGSNVLRYNTESGSSFRVKRKSISENFADRMADINHDDEVYNNLGRLVSDNKSKYDDIIFYPKGADHSELVHEIGHKRNSISRNPIKRKLDDLNMRYQDDISEMKGSSKSGLLNAVKEFVKGKAVVADESNASKEGLKLLKGSGATKDEIDDARKLYNLKLNTYKHKSNANYKSTILNTIKPKE